MSIWLVSGLISVIFVISALCFKGVLLGYMMYLGGLFIATDIIRGIIWLVCRQTVVARAWDRLYSGGLLPLMLAFAFCVYAYYNAKKIRITNYYIREEQFTKAQNNLRIVMLSDIHLGAGVKPGSLEKILERVQQQKPDIVLLCGDVYEENTTPAQYDASFNAFSRISARLGIYYVPGNHEYGAQQKNKLDIEQLACKLKNVGVTMLRDAAKLIDNSFYLVGRDDTAAGERKPLSALMEDIGAKLPVVLMGHRPVGLKEGEAQAVRLQLFGHTHAGQLFPTGKLRERLGRCEMLYGHRVSGCGSHTIVSSGVGTWGFSMRIGSPCEIVVVDMY
ncbi:metallophosphoesterase [Eubacteriales bacterium OttesenSCG-928-K08]|nr:metallophosphoesterase [Eubacteriales bacterium OttesenSCG-928-K08]